MGEVAHVTKLAGFEFTEYIEYKDDGEIIALRALNVKSGRLNLDNIKRIDKEVSDKLTRSKLHVGDILFTYVGTIGEVAVIDENDKYHLAPNVALIRTDDIVPEFLMYSLLSEYGRKEIVKYQTTTSQPALSMENIRRVKLPIPPLLEQRKIATILSIVDGHIDEVDGMIGDLKEMKKGLMQKLLTEGIGHTKFKDSAVGRIPVEWEVKPLDEMMELITGFPFKSKDFSEDDKHIQLLRGINIGEGNFKWNSDINKYWPKSNDELTKYELKVNDLVISMDGSKVGKNYAMITNEILPLLLVQRVACIRTNSSLDQKYLYHVVASNLFKSYVDKVKTSSGIPHISAKQLKEFKIPYPTDINEQIKIAEILSMLDVRITDFKDELFQLKQLKKGLMQQLLTGKTRVRIDN